MAASKNKSVRTSTSSRGGRNFGPVGANRTSKANGAMHTAPTFEQIQQRAFELYLGRGDGHGDELGDWLNAELELKSQPAAP
jgi:hypothetical protein